MKQCGKRFFAVLLSTALILALGVPAYADGSLRIISDGNALNDGTTRIISDGNAAGDNLLLLAAAEGTAGTFNGSPAQVDANGNLLLNKENFPDANFYAFIKETLDVDGTGVLTLEQALAVTELFCLNREIADLSGIEYFSELSFLHCGMNPLTSLDLSANTKLKTILCSFTQLTTLNVTGNTALERLDCSDTPLTSLNVAGLSTLNVLYANRTKLTSLDASGLTALQELSCNNNQLISLDVSGDTALWTLQCSGNKLPCLDLSQNTTLTSQSNMSLGNQTVEMVAKNTNGVYTVDMSTLVDASDWDRIHVTAGGSYDSATGIVTLPAVTAGVDTISFSYSFKTYDGDNASALLIVDAIVSLPDNGSAAEGTFNGLPAQVDAAGNLLINEANFPDPAFRTLILKEYDTQRTGFLTEQQVLAVTTLLCDEIGASSMQGVEYFSKLQSLQCAYNTITELDVSHNTELTDLGCNGNKLTAIDVSNNPELTRLFCGDQPISQLDVSQNLKLTKLQCQVSALSSVDLSKNTALNEIYFESTALKSLDLSNNTSLSRIDVTANRLETLILPARDELAVFSCGKNRLAALDLSGVQTISNFSVEPQSIFLTAAATDESYTVDMGAVVGADNVGRITITSGQSYDKTTGILTVCALSGTKPGTITYTYDTGNPTVPMNVTARMTYEGSFNGADAIVDASGNLMPWDENFPDQTFLDVVMQLVAQVMDALVTDDMNNVTSIDTGNKGVSNLKGLEFFVNLGELNCSDNDLSSLNTSNNPNLERIECANNSLTVLDTSDNPMLVEIDCNGNKITNLDLAMNTDLKALQCDGNHIAWLDLSTNTLLEPEKVDLGVQSIKTSGSGKDGRYTVDMKLVVGAENIGRISVSYGGYDDYPGYNKETGILTIDETDEAALLRVFRRPFFATLLGGTDAASDLSFTYYVDTGAKNLGDEQYMQVNASLEITGEELLADVKIENPAGATLTAPSNGWQAGVNEFLIQNDIPCVVAVSQNGGESYQTLTPTADPSGGYRFQLELSADTRLQILAKGDANGDATVSTADMDLLKKLYLGKPTEEDLETIRPLACDLNGDGKISVPDIAMVKAACLGHIDLSW